MTDAQWNEFCSFKEKFAQKVAEWSALSQELTALQKAAAQKDTPLYQVENPVVYNTHLDRITPADEIRYIIIGDNPGKNEQLTKNQAYLVGQSGKIADGFFARTPELHTDFRKNVIILNKTPVHTAKTNHLKYLLKNGSPAVCALITESQKWMAEETAKLHTALLQSSKNGDVPELWLVGYSELKEKGIFSGYKKLLRDSYKLPGGKAAWNKVFVYQHFSMNCFLRDLNNFSKANPELSTQEALHALGTLHKQELFG